MIDLKKVTSDPGVYIYRDANKKIIYIGKAKNLNARVKSYFTNSPHSSKTNLLVAKIDSVETIIVDNEVEALLLENKLIKKNQPKYNIMLKDSKTFAYIKLTDDPYPRITQTRKVSKKGTYFGPFTDSTVKNELLRLTSKVFKLRTCKSLPKRACLNYHIGLCTAPCVAKVDPEQYHKQVVGATKFLKGNSSEIVAQLESEMKKSAESTHYEIALEKKRQLDAILYLQQKQKVDLHKNYDQHIIAIKKDATKAMIVLFTINKGVLSGKREFHFPVSSEILQSFIKRYYGDKQPPYEILLSEACWEDEHEKEILEEYLKRMRNAKVILNVPKIAEKKALVDLALKNIATRTITALEELKDALNLNEYPRVIECFDISNLGDEHIVAGMTQWVDGVPNNQAYRRFEMKSVTAQDDPKSMHEAVLRRYRRLSNENLAFPNLIVIDGGITQLNAALEALKSLGLTIPIISLAKEEEEIYLPNAPSPLPFDKSSPMMLLLRSIRDSVHTYVLSYNRKKREMELREQVKSAQKK
ncbi:MAG: excinuclease ABC subunit UvrC [Nanoarchaeota archaeon]|nr:excinuclease ABC subunit UvrC [Nanoarchaeota archaeon]